MSALAPDITPETRLRRALASDYLQFLGFQVAETTLATLVTRGGGPPMERFGRFVTYRAGPLVKWAEERTSAPASSSSERTAA